MRGILGVVALVSGDLIASMSIALGLSRRTPHGIFVQPSSSERRTPLVIREVWHQPLSPGDVLVRIGASGLCHTDLEVIEGQLAYPLPIVLGHEGAGTVEAVGSAVTLVKPGDKVVCSWNPNCGRCFYCDRDQPILCEPFTMHQPHGRLTDGTIRLRMDGEPLHHFSVVSSHAEYTVVPESGAISPVSSAAA